MLSPKLSASLATSLAVFLESAFCLGISENKKSKFHSLSLVFCIATKIFLICFCLFLFTCTKKDPLFSAQNSSEKQPVGVTNIRPNMQNCSPLNDHFKKIEDTKICLQADGNLIEFSEAKNHQNCIKQNAGLIPCRAEDEEIYYRRIR